jgi:hypothetical protein
VNWTVTIRSKAKADLRRAHDWYEERCPGLGNEFLADHAEALLRLEADPERFPLYYRARTIRLTAAIHQAMRFILSSGIFKILVIVYGRAVDKKEAS